MVHEKELVGSLLLVSHVNLRASGGGVRTRIHHLDPSRTVWGGADLLNRGGGDLRPDDVVPCVEKLDEALEFQLHAMVGIDAVSSVERSFIHSL